MTVMGVPLIGFSLVCLWVLIADPSVRTRSDDWIWLAAGILSSAGIAAWLIGEVASVRVIVSPDAIELRRFWTRRWRGERPHVRLAHGLGGDVPVIPALVATDVRSGERIGVVLKTQFEKADIDWLHDALERDHD